MCDESFNRTFCRAFGIPYDNPEEKKGRLANLRNELIYAQHGLSEFVLTLLELVQKIYPDKFRSIQE